MSPTSWTPDRVASVVLSIFALCVSILSFVVAVKNYFRKSGILVRGFFSLSSSISSDDHCVASVFLENLKDRAVTVFGIYLRIGHHNYIKIEDFEDKPLILRGFESVRREYGPIEYYSFNLVRIKLDSLLKDQRIRKRLVLRTSEGKYVVPAKMGGWLPTVDYFRNQMTIIADPMISTYKGRYVGRNVIYLVDIEFEAENRQIVDILRDSVRIPPFKTFLFTDDSLQTKQSLEAFLSQQYDRGLLPCKRFTVIDVEESRRNRDLFPKETFEAEYANRFSYFILGRIATIVRNRIVRRNNAENFRATRTGIDVDRNDKPDSAISDPSRE